MLASVTMCNDDMRNYNSKISDLGYLTYKSKLLITEKIISKEKVHYGISNN